MTLPALIGAHHGDEPPAATPAAPQPPARDAINRAALDKIRALSRERGDALVDKVVAAYVDDTPRQLAALKDAIGRHDTGDVRRIAHTLKSASANVGAEALAALCKAMEQLGRADILDTADDILADMEEEFQAVRHSLTAVPEKET
jgi:HPt (histidine-containing phosphotransfer) domain-containing protein